MTDPTATRIAEIVAVVTHTRPAADPATVTRAGLEEWDSLAHVEILFAVEEEFDVEFDDAAMRNAAGVRDIAAEVARLRTAPA